MSKEAIALLPTRIASRIDFNGPIVDGMTTPCWIWMGSRTRKNYGRTSVKSRNAAAHRLVYESIIGPIPDGLEIDHLCVNPPCVNPEHLDVVTHAENMFRLRQTHCKRGHMLTGDNRMTTNPNGRSGTKCRQCHNERRKTQYHLRKGKTDV